MLGQGWGKAPPHQSSGRKGEGDIICFRALLHSTFFLIESASALPNPKIGYIVDREFEIKSTIF